MGKHRSIMSENLKSELAKEIGVYDIVEREGRGSLTSRDCGNIVTAAIKYAEKAYEDEKQ